MTFDDNNVPEYHFYLQDHLSNNRVVINQNGTVEQINHYYPYGGLMTESTNDESHKFYTSYAEVTNGEIVVTSKSFDANITPVTTTGFGYPGAFVYEPVNGFWEMRTII